MIPPTMNISRDARPDDLLFVQSADGCDPVKNDVPDEPLAIEEIAREDPCYYFRDAIFLVEDTFFKIPRHHFEQDSAFFRDMFSVEADKGWSKENPFRLNDISKRDFVTFLKVICPRHFLQRETLSFDDWVSVLKLSTVWDFQDARRTAIDNLPVTTGDDPITRIELADIYQVRQWTLPALQMLATREDRVTAQDVERLGLQFSLNVAELQGKVKGFNRGRGSTGGFGSFSVQACPVVEFIEELFPAAIVPRIEDPALVMTAGTPAGPASEELVEVPWPEPNDVFHSSVRGRGRGRGRK